MLISAAAGAPHYIDACFISLLQSVELLSPAYGCTSKRVMPAIVCVCVAVSSMQDAVPNTLDHHQLVQFIDVTCTAVHWTQPLQLLYYKLINSTINFPCVGYVYREVNFPCVDKYVHVVWALLPYMVKS